MRRPNNSISYIAHMLKGIELSYKDGIYLIGMILTATRLEDYLNQAEQNVTAKTTTTTKRNKITTKQKRTKP